MLFIMNVQYAAKIIAGKYNTKSGRKNDDGLHGRHHYVVQCFYNGNVTLVDFLLLLSWQCSLRTANMFSLVRIVSL